MEIYQWKTLTIENGWKSVWIAEQGVLKYLVTDKEETMRGFILRFTGIWLPFVMREDEKRAWVNPWYYKSDPVIFYLQWCLTSYSYGTTMEATHSNNMKSHGRL